MGNGKEEEQVFLRETRKEKKEIMERRENNLSFNGGNYFILIPQSRRLKEVFVWARVYFPLID